MTVETVETVVAAAPYAALIGHKLRPLLSDSQSALADCEEDVIQICHLLSRNGKLSLVRLTKSFPTIPNLRGIANANQNDERLKCGQLCCGAYVCEQASNTGVMSISQVVSTSTNPDETKTVGDILQEKHPVGSPMQPGAVLFGPRWLTSSQ